MRLGILNTMRDASDVIYEFDTTYGHYQVVDMVYDGRPARVLFSGDRQAAQSGVATDTATDLLFDYNQRMFELVTGLAPRRLLMIGGGMYTLPSALLDALDDIAIDVVELDDGLEAVATKYFGLQANPRLTIMHDDGLKYLAANTEVYDMIVVDAYTHDSPEPTLGSPEAIAHMRRGLSAHGVVAANVIAAYYGRRSQALQRLAAVYQTEFSDVGLFPASQSLSLWLPQNLIMAAVLTNDIALDQYIRYHRLDRVAQPFDLGRDLLI